MDLNALWTEMLNLFNTVLATVAGFGGGVKGISGGVLGALGAAYCLVKVFEAAHDAGTSNAPMLVVLKEGFRVARKALLVGAFTASIAGIATAVAVYGQGRVAAVATGFGTNMGKIVKVYDSYIKSIGGSMMWGPAVAAKQYGLTNAMMSGKEYVNAVMPRAALTPGPDGLVQIGTLLGDVKKNNSKFPSVDAGAMDAAVAAAADSMKRYAQADKELSTLDKAKQAGARVVKSAATFGISEMLRAMHEWGNYLLAHLLGWLAFGIALIGLAAGAITVFKEGFGGLSYLVGVAVSMAVASAIAVPFGPAFIMCFLTPATEPYGRSYVQFLCSFMFSALGLFLAGKIAGALITGCAGTLLAKIGPNVANMFRANGSGLFIDALAVAIGAVAAGMVVSFFAETMRRGAAIGGGFWSGSFNA